MSHIVVPIDRLKPETLQALLEEFVTRDGAVHGHTDASLQAQMEAVRRQLKSGKAVIVFDDEDDSCTIRAADELRKAESSESNVTRTEERASEPEESSQNDSSEPPPES
jgi:uncharacterized protein YheU (UPF0270 family)